MRTDGDKSQWVWSRANPVCALMRGGGGRARLGGDSLIVVCGQLISGGGRIEDGGDHLGAVCTRSRVVWARPNVGCSQRVAVRIAVVSGCDLPRAMCGASPSRAARDEETRRLNTGTFELSASVRGEDAATCASRPHVVVCEEPSARNDARPCGRRSSDVGGAMSVVWPWTTSGGHRVPSGGPHVFTLAEVVSTAIALNRRHCVPLPTYRSGGRNAYTFLLKNFRDRSGPPHDRNMTWHCYRLLMSDGAHCDSPAVKNFGM